MLLLAVSLSTSVLSLSLSLSLPRCLLIFELVQNFHNGARLRRRRTLFLPHASESLYRERSRGERKLAKFSERGSERFGDKRLAADPQARRRVYTPLVSSLSLSLSLLLGSSSSLSLVRPSAMSDCEGARAAITDEHMTVQRRIDVLIFRGAGDSPVDTH